MVHLGSKIKEQAKSMGIGATKFGEYLNRSRENVYDLYERESVDTGLLLACCKILNHDFFQYLYEEEPLETFRQLEIARRTEEMDALNREINHLHCLLKKNEELLELQRKYISELEAKQTPSP